MKKILRCKMKLLKIFTILLIFSFQISHESYSQYCTPSYSSGCIYGDDISNFTFIGESSSIINSNTEGCPSSPSGYANLTASFSADVLPGNTYTGTISTSYSCCQWFRIWIDLNNDGTFSASELLHTSGEYGSGSSASFSITIPTGTTPGAKRMRVRSVYYGSSIDPCTSYSYGEAHDYTIIVIAPDPCEILTFSEGVLSAPTEICPFIPFVVENAGSTMGSGITRVWQQSIDGGTTWTTIAGESGINLMVSAGISVATSYRCIVACPAGSSEDTTNVVTVAIASPVDCYCEPSPAGGVNYITDVYTTGGITDISRSSWDEYYTDLSSSHIVTQVQGSTIEFTVTETGSEGYCKIWIDWNQNGSFLDPGELVYYYEPYPYTSYGLYTFTGTITVPYSALPGVTRMRIFTDWHWAPYYGYPEMDPCASTTWGEVEDYGFMVIEAVPCEDLALTSGTLTGVSICPSTTFTIVNSGSTLASGMSRVWQKRVPSGSGTWTTIAGAVDVNYIESLGVTADTDYRCIVTCTASGETDTTNVVTATLLPAVDCICEPFHEVSTCTWGAYISSFSTSGAEVDVSTTTTCTTGGYSDYRSTHTIEAIQGTSFSVTATIGSYSGQVRIWADWNQNGIFESTEMVSESSTWITYHSGTITVPTTALPGPTVLRVRAVEDSYFDPCATYYYGEAEDYTLLVIPPCGQPTALTLDDNTITTAEISWTEPAELPDVGYRIYLSTSSTAPNPMVAPPTVSVPSGTSSYTFTGLLAETTYYVWIVGDCGASAYSTVTGPLTFTTAPACNPPASVGFSTITHNSAYAAWPAPVPAPTEGYEYYYSDIPTPPTSGTTPTGTSTLTFAGLTGLASATTYYVWVRAVCYEDEPSPWSVMGTFTTLPGCLTPSGLSASATSWSTADVSWTAVVPAPSGGYDYYYSTDATAPTSGTTPSGSTTSTSVSLTGLTGSTTYYVWVRSDCGSPLGESGWSIVPVEFVTPLQNDDAAGAFEITVGGGCVSPYTNVTASVATDEPFPSCIGTDGYGIVWFKFTAPSSGQVKISNDYAVGGTPMGDSKIGLFEVGDVADYSTFTIVACDDDNGFVSPGKSILYAADLTPGMDYYVAVSAKTSGDEGDFCITIEEMDDSHLSALDDCTPTTPLVNMNEDYYGWLSIVDGSGNLIALVRPNAFAGAGTFSLDASQYIEGGSVRLDSLGTPYMDRNITINNTGNVITDADVRFYFLDSELADLDGVTLGTVGVSKYSPSSTCLDAYPTGIMPEYLTQEASGAIGTMRWVEVNVTGFSTFFLHGGAGPLDVNLGQLTAENKGAINQLFWSSVSEKTKELTYIIERSDDGRAFSEIGSTAAKGKASNYSFTDISPVDGINYYRVKAVDATNRTLYTNVAIAEVVVSNILTAYPNPTKDVVNVSIHKLGTNAKLSVTDVHGRVLQEIELGTQTHVQVNLEAYAQGTYYIKYSDDTTSQTFKVNKQ